MTKSAYIIMWNLARRYGGNFVVKLYDESYPGCPDDKKWRARAYIDFRRPFRNFTRFPIDPYERYGPTKKITKETAIKQMHRRFKWLLNSTYFYNYQDLPQFD